MAAVVCLTALSGIASANWLTKLMKEAGEAGADAGRLAGKTGVSSLDHAAAAISKLPDSPGHLMLATHMTPEGQWTFANRTGEVFTAATAAELDRVVRALAPDAAGTNPSLALYLSEDTLFAHNRSAINLPDNAKLHVVVGAETYPLVRRADAGGGLWAEVRPNVLLETRDRELFKEALWQLGRPLAKADVRILSMSSGGPPSLGVAPRLDSTGKSALVEPIDPDHLLSSFDGIRGQTVVVTGRVEADLLSVDPGSGTARAIKLEALKSAAAKNDVNLIVLATREASQPGSRNWLWQRIEVDGLKDALARATYADFLDALGTRHGGLAVTVTKQSSTRIRLDASAAGPAAEAPGMIGDILGEVVSNATGNVVAAALQADLNASSWQKELDRRIIPGVPSTLQFAYLASLIAGLIGLNVARRWWSRIWQPERRRDYPSAFAYQAARFAKLLLFVVVFMPLVGVPAAAVGTIQQLWALVTLPFRLIAWLFGLGRTRSA